MPDLKCFDKLVVTNLVVERRRFSVIYKVVRDGHEESYRLLHTYEEDLPAAETPEFAALAAAVPAINYALFCDEIVFDIPLTALDIKFIEDMVWVNARDIFVNRIVKRTGFVKPEYVPCEEEVKPSDAEPRAKLTFTKVVAPGASIENLDYSKCAVMMGGGKDSLLTYALMRRVGCEVYPCFLNESGHHWLTAFKAYRYLRERDPNTKRVWSNVDRLFTFIESRMKILVENATRKKRAEIYPIRLFFFEHYVFSFLPLLLKYRVGNVMLGSEYDDPTCLSYELQGIRHYCATYDQSQEFDKYMTRWFELRGFKFRQWSAVRPLSGLVIERMLYHLEPELFKLQVSCHSAHKEGDEIVPCGTCSKCNGILLLLLANGIDPKLLKYKKEHVVTLPARLARGRIRLEKNEVEHAIYLAKKDYGFILGEGKPHEHVEMVHFDELNSHFDNIPSEFREQLYEIFERFTRGYAVLCGGEWISISREEALSGKLRSPFEGERQVSKLRAG